MNFVQRPSAHFEDRKGGVQPTFLILHYTETVGMKDAEDYFLARKEHPEKKKVSAHYMVDEDGSVYQYVDEEKRAWHAGLSYWDGLDDINTHSIGIEIVNPGHKYGYREFPPAQMNAVAALCKDILSRHAIPAHRVVAHSDIAPDRKIDPGELFPWRDLAAQGIGLWPAPLKEDFTQAADDTAVRAALTAYGYDPRVDFKAAVTAFQRHFHQEVFKTPEQVGQVTADTAARLYALLRLKV